MPMQTLKLVTIIAEELLKERICKKTLALGATGYSCVKCEGEGARGVRDETMQGSNIKIEIVCSADVAQAIMTYVAEKFFDNFAVIAWVSEVSVIRGAHYVKQ